MKCIVIETSPERTNAHPVTNENGTPHVYATISEARAELKANGYSYNRANDRYYIKGTEYRAYIIREDSEEYADAITATAAEEPEQTTAEIIAEQARELYHDTIYSAITDNDIKQADAYTNEHLKLTVEVMDALGIFHASNRMLVAIAQAMRWTLEDIEAKAIEEAHDRAAAALIDAYADAIGDSVTADDPEAIAAHRVARACIGLSTATDDDRATVSAMVEAIADRARTTAADDAAADPEDLEEPAPIYQRYELLAYLGEPDDYDVDAIEAEATAFTATGEQVWTAFGDDLAAIAERHEIVTYYAI